MPEILEGTPAESRTHDAKAIGDVFERILAPSESVKTLRTFRLRNKKRPKAYTDTPCPVKIILSPTTDRDLILSRKSILRSQKKIFFFSQGVYPDGTYYTQGAPRRIILAKTSRGEEPRN